MINLALYRKYRPQSIEKFAGQNEIVKTLTNSISNNKISHAYIFAGPRGTGKTSMAKIIAKMVNCEHLIDGKLCGKCTSCLNAFNCNDIIEIDAASNNGIEEIRELKEKTRIMPNALKYKVYIIDEVHMMTVQAFNALLKTLEEPPSHVIFILATTELNKVPATILSRCQKFIFKKISYSDMKTKLNEIITNEKINISSEAVDEIIRISDGGLRDAINLLDQLFDSNDDKIEIENVFDICGLFSNTFLKEILINIKKVNNCSVIELLEKAFDEGKSSIRLLEEILNYIQKIIIYINTADRDINSDYDEIMSYYSESDLYVLIEKIVKMSSFVKNTDYSNIYLISNFLNIYTVNTVDKKINTETNKCLEVESKVDTKVETVDSPNVNINTRVNNAFATANKEKLLEFKSQWDSIIENFEKDDNFSSILGIICDTIPVVVGNEYVIFSTKYDSSANVLNKKIIQIEKKILTVIGNKYKIIFLSECEWKKNRDEYIVNIRNGKEYAEISEKLLNNSKITSKSPVDKLIDLIGNDIIEYKN